VQNCKEANKRAEGAEQELKEVKKKLEEMALKQAEDENTNQIQVLHGVMVFLNMHFILNLSFFFVSINKFFNPDSRHFCNYRHNFSRHKTKFTEWQRHQDQTEKCLKKGMR